MKQKIFGITGWKNSGKTGLMERLVAHITGLGYTVSTIKHAHHSFDVDHPGRDSYRHRAAGASEVMLASKNRWALMQELRGAPEPSFDMLLAQMAPVDLILVEGYKRESHAKLECYRGVVTDALRAGDDPTICAVASDVALDIDITQFDLDNTAQIAAFILDHQGLSK
ncbi:molybdopterin-guanine dinucleotide biosynthesis protein B [Amylibacter marinus]|uniref:Molybdopterin-guanine dinucleotide biosynthesis protein B n=1 Tax=Amylibacter marinus TaxID=1475483 RepID=A0ABQ5VXQ2_9RHOB|nr:molybdopterin-guanine dinucleotide biosynthesis protein B [Amylibacter marinus]GLQ35863.1 molybdopterin-guanine dinucleotide biosynthesis protein B [Amylibacter marinus]